MVEIAGIALAAYLLGSVPFGVLIAKRRGVDIQAVGSGNIGATNVARNLGRKLGVLVLILDALKGFVPATFVGTSYLHGVDPTAAFAALTVAPVVGHCLPVWLKFHGGKGVATGFGVFLAIDPVAAGVCVAVFATVYAATKIASVSSMTAALTMPVALWLMDYPMPKVWITLGIAVFIIARHHQNIRRLLGSGELRV